MINVPSLIDIIHDGLNQLMDADKKSIKYQIESSRISPSLYIYKTTASGSLNILRVSDHLPHMQGLVRDGNIPRPSADDGANVSIDFYIPKKAEPIGKASEKKRKKFIKNEFKNFVGVPITIPTVKPFTVTSYEYSYKNLEQQDEMIIWHCIATWISCLKPDRVFHDPFAQDKVKKAKVETKIANVKVFGDTIEITESKSNKNMKKTITESQLRQIVKESVKKVLNEISYKTAMKAYQGLIERGDWQNNPQKAKNFLSHLKDRAPQNFDPNLDVIVVGGEGQGKYKAGELSQYFDIRGYVEPSENNYYNDSILIGAPRLRGYLGPMNDNGRLRYETQEVYDILSM